MKRRLRKLGYGCGVVLLALLAAGGALALVNHFNEAYAIRPVDGQFAPAQTAAQAAAQDAGQALNAGAFLITWDAAAQHLRVSHRDNPAQVVWENVPGVPFVAAGVGQAAFSDSRAHFHITDNRRILCTRQQVTAVTAQDGAVLVAGTLDCDDGQPAGYTLLFAPDADNMLRFDLRTDRTDINRLYLTGASPADEHIMGFGVQFSFVDMKGRYLPVFVQEQGIGRGAQPVTLGANLQAGAGGDWHDSYAPVPYYLTSQRRAFFLWNNEYSAFDMRQSDRVQVTVFSGQMSGGLLYGDSPAALVETYTGIIGRMPPLPEWITRGAVVGMQGGTARVREVYALLRDAGVPVAGFWLQDWVGRRETSFGSQLWWNWELDDARYPDWERLQSDLAVDGVRLMIYVSPYLVDAADKPGVQRNLYAEAVEQGYVVRHADGSPFLLRITDFSAALVDLTNPQAAAWYSDVLAEQVRLTGAAGWMADFGEGLPVDAVLFDGSSGDAAHNRYPEQWAQFNAELVERLNGAGDYVYFLRSGYRGSPAYSTLFWLGDQMVTWDDQDGIKTAVMGLLTGGISGFTFSHSDIGGYTTITNPLGNYHRSRELLFRWMELNAFSVVFRTHEGNQPQNNAQFYDDAGTLAHFARTAQMYAAWDFYRRDLITAAAERGLPVVRPMFLVFPDDPLLYSIRYEQFMIGEELLVAPVLDPGMTQVTVYLPAGEWVHLWSGQVYSGGQRVSVPAPLGEPGVFYPQGSAVGAQFAANLRAAGVLD